MLVISHKTINQHVGAGTEHGGTLYTHLPVITKSLRERSRTYDSRGPLAGKRQILNCFAPPLSSRKTMPWLHANPMDKTKALPMYPGCTGDGTN